MDHQNILMLGCLTLVAAISAFIIWGSSPRSRRKKGQVVGLVNLGSTCFVNTLLQALASCALFLQWLNQQKHEENSLTSSLNHILWVLNGYGTADVHSPVEVLTALKRHGWIVSAGEQDAHELFNVIVSTLQEETTTAVKVGSLSNALYSSDTLSQSSELLEDSELSVHMNSEEIIGSEESKKLNVTDGDDSSSELLPIADSSSGTLTQFEDALDKLNHGDTLSQSSAANFYSLEQRSPYIENRTNSVDHCGDCEDSSKISKGETSSTMENSFSNINSSKGYIQRFKVSQESFKEKSPEFTGCYDRVSGCSPCIPMPNSPPFQGFLTSALQCSECSHHSSVRYDTFDSVSLALGDTFHKKVLKLQDLLQKFVRTEIIPDVDCEKCCKKTIAFKTLSFGKLPSCLCLRIARTAWQAYSHTSTKREDFVEFPEYLPMDEYTISTRLKKCSFSSFKAHLESLNSTEKRYKYMYRLKSVVVHIGGVDSGHFLTYRRGTLNTKHRHRVGKLAGACMDSQSWYLTSDDKVKVSTLYEVMDSLAYMLFYEKCYFESNEELVNEHIPKKVLMCDVDEEDSSTKRKNIFEF